MKSIKAMARMEVLTKHQMSWKADANSPQQMEAEALFNTIDSLGDGNGTLELYEVVLYVQVYRSGFGLGLGFRVWAGRPLRAGAKEVRRV